MSVEKERWVAERSALLAREAAAERRAQLVVSPSPPPSPPGHSAGLGRIEWCVCVCVCVCVRACVRACVCEADTQTRWRFVAAYK